MDRPRPGPPGGSPGHPPAPAPPTPPAPAPAPAPQPGPVGPTLNIALQNNTTSSNVSAYITGRAIDNGGALVLILADGRTPFFPPSPSQDLAPIPADCAISLGSPGSTTSVTIPHIAGGRIYFAIDAPLHFFLNRGPALVEPSPVNPSDPNANVDWGFAEFTFNPDQLFANISFVDFVGPPIGMTLTTRSGGTQQVAGMNADGLDRVCDGLRAQQAKDGQGWDQLIMSNNGRNLRALSPNLGMVMNANLFAHYYDDYVNRAWAHFGGSLSLSIDTQTPTGVVSGQAVADQMVFNGRVFTKPTTHDIFGCNSGPFVVGNDDLAKAIIPRLAAALNRSTLLVSNVSPTDKSFYYQDAVTNHYSRIVHEAELDGKGYAFPYDDVQTTGGPDQSGEVHAGDPLLWTVAVGGGH